MQDITFGGIAFAFVLVVAGFMLGFTAGSYSPDDGNEHGACYPNNTCNEGLNCVEEYNRCFDPRKFQNICPVEESRLNE